MPDKTTIRRAQIDKRQGKSASTQAGEFVREEMDHIRAGKHGARSAKQAIAVGLSKARRAGVALPAPKKGAASTKTRQPVQLDLTKAKSTTRKEHGTSKRAVAGKRALKREGRAAASPLALSRHAQAAARQRSNGARPAGSAGTPRTNASAARTQSNPSVGRKSTSTKKAPAGAATTARKAAGKASGARPSRGARKMAQKLAKIPSKNPVKTSKSIRSPAKESASGGAFSTTPSPPKSPALTAPKNVRGRDVNGRGRKSSPPVTAKKTPSAAAKKKQAADHLWQLVQQKKQQAAQTPPWRALEHGGHMGAPVTDLGGDAKTPLLPQFEMHGHRDRGGG